MPKYTSDDIKIIHALDHIRSKPWMYVRNPRKSLPSILSLFVESFIHLGIQKFSIQEIKNFFIIKTTTDWFDNNKATLHDLFNGLQGYDNDSWDERAEVFLTAFYFPYYTTGQAGDYGDKNLFEEYSNAHNREQLKHNGRLLLISKEQALPDNNGIIFEQPPQSLAELENQKRWLDEIIAAMKSKNCE